MKLVSKGGTIESAVIVHHAEPHHALDLVLAQPRDRLVVERENAPRVSEQAFAGRAQLDIGLGPVKQRDVEAILEPPDLHADGGLGPVEPGCGARERAMVGHRDKGLQQLRIEGREVHHETLFLISRKFHSLISSASLWSLASLKCERADGMSEIWGVLAAVLSSGLGGTSIGATRYLVNAVDPLAIGSFRFGIGFLFLLPLAWWKGDAWPRRQDWPGVAGLGVLYFALFPILFNASLIFTTAARGSLALSTLPLLTMLVGAALGSEALTARKSDRRADRDGRRGAGAAVGAFLRTCRRLARRSLDGRRRALHGALQHLVEAVHPPLGSHSLHHDVDGGRCALPDPGVVVARQLCARGGIRPAAMGRGVLSRRLRCRAHLLSLGVCAGADHADAGGDLGDGQSGHRVAGRCMAASASR